MISKVCTKCGVNKSLAMFKRGPTYKLGIRSNCKVCDVNYSKEWRSRNRVRSREGQRVWRAANKDKVAAYAAKVPRCRKAAYQRQSVVNHVARTGHHYKNTRNVVSSMAQNKRNKENLSAAYVAAILRISVKDAPPELIEAYRVHLKIVRLTRGASK